MIVSPEYWEAILGAVEDEAADSAEKGLAVLFSLQEVETVCALKLLQQGLDAKGLPYSTFPVGTYADVRATLNALLSGSNDYRTVVLLNCCAGRDVRERGPDGEPPLAPSDCSGVRYVVVDSHRPLAHTYHDQEHDVLVVLADDDPLRLDEVPLASEFDRLTADDRELLEAEARAEQEREEEEQEEDGGGDDSPAKRARLEGLGRRFYRDRLRDVRAHERRLAEYYDMGSSYGKPSPLVLLTLVELLMGHAADIKQLWPAAVALTDHWVHQRVSPAHHREWYKQLAELMRARDPAGPGADPAAITSRPRVLVGDAGRDYRIMLHRHWNLFDAFCFSPYVAPRLQTWRRGGQDSVQLLFANMGISIEQAKTPFDSMHSMYRGKFMRRLEAAVAPTLLSFKDLATEGFVLAHNRKLTAASDVVHACTALLSEHALHDAPPGTAEGATGFWAAAAAVDSDTVEGWKQFTRGVEMAKVMQQAIIRDGGLLVSDRKLMANAACCLQELDLHTLPPTNAREFRHPLTLLRLAHFVRDATRIARRAGAGARAAAAGGAGGAGSNFPVLVVGPEDATGHCLVIGLRAGQLERDAQYNVFGSTFRQIVGSGASDIAWDAAREAFDAAVLHVHKDAVAAFVYEVRDALRRAAREAEEAAALEQEQQQRERERELEAAAAAAAAGAGAAAAAVGGGGGGAAGAHGGGGEEEGAAGGGGGGDDDADGEELIPTDAGDDAADGDGAAGLAFVDAVAASDDGEDDGAPPQQLGDGDDDDEP